ncbi:MAG: UDP-N-acetylglucosamine--undecaprenyl-phosphate N-acetylglucosaminephosphotransferase [Rhodocyclaceae bacterium]
MSTFLAAGVLTAILVLVLKSLAHRFGLLDRPGGHKQHREPVPVVGGIAMFLSIALLETGQRELGLSSSTLWALGVLVATGVIDDRHGIPPLLKMAAQALAALVIVFGDGLMLASLGDLFGFGEVRLGWLAVPFTIFAVVGIINAANMFDGLDGLAGSMGAVALAWFAAAALILGLTVQMDEIFVLKGALIGFLLFNLRLPWRRRAAVFMGDAGSMMLGFVLAWIAMVLSQRPGGMPPIVAVWILALPILDTLSVMARRIRKGRNPFAPDREHLHHVLERAGLSVERTVVVLAAASSAFGLVGLAAWRAGVPEAAMFYAFLLLLALYHWAMARAWRIATRARRILGSGNGPGHFPEAQAKLEGDIR